MGNPVVGMTGDEYREYANRTFDQRCVQFRRADGTIIEGVLESRGGCLSDPVKHSKHIPKDAVEWRYVTVHGCHFWDSDLSEVRLGSEMTPETDEFTSV